MTGTTSTNVGGNFVQTMRIHIHPLYNVVSRTNDISLVQSAAVIVFNVQVQPIRVASTFSGGGLPVVASGWLMPGQNPAVLAIQSLQTITNAECRTRRAAAGDNPNYVYDNILCTDTMTANASALCHEDSGAPLVGRNELVGINAWVFGCVRNSPDVYTRAASHRAWISSISGIV